MRAHLLILAAGLAASAPASAATRNFGVATFDRIRVTGPFVVRLSTGVAPYARASGSQAALDRVLVEVQGRTAIVRINPSWGGYPGADPGPVEVAIGTRDLNNAILIGSGSLHVDRVKGLDFTMSVQGSGAASIGQAETDHLKLFIAGSAGTTVAGRTGKLTASLRGVSTLDASGLTAKTADLGAEGPSTLKATVTDAAKVNASGAGTVSLAGNPACTSTLSGSASVSGCKPR